MYCKICDAQSEIEVCQNCQDLIKKESYLLIPGKVFESHTVQVSHMATRYQGYRETLDLYETKDAKKEATKSYLLHLKAVSASSYLPIPNADVSKIVKYLISEMKAGKEVEIEMVTNDLGVEILWGVKS